MTIDASERASLDVVLDRLIKTHARADGTDDTEYLRDLADELELIAAGLKMHAWQHDLDDDQDDEDE